MTTAQQIGVLESLVAAINRHDLDALVDHFSEGVLSDTPAHPARSFAGRAQVRSNWATILGAISDLRATLVATGTGTSASGAETAWAELAFDGRAPDGASWEMRGVTVNEIVEGRIAALRFYLEPIDRSSLDADGAVATVVRSKPAAPVGVGGSR